MKTCKHQHNNICNGYPVVKKISTRNEWKKFTINPNEIVKKQFFQTEVFLRRYALNNFKTTSYST